jgi:aminoglycoside phosphotransferase family enzyme
MEILKKLRILKRRADQNQISKTETLNQLTETLNELFNYNKKDIREIACQEEIQRVKRIKDEAVKIGNDVIQEQQRKDVLFG